MLWYILFENKENGDFTKVLFQSPQKPTKEQAWKYLVSVGKDDYMTVDFIFDVPVSPIILQ